MTTSSANSRDSGLPRFFALIPCAGQGSRAGTSVPKQYQPVAGRAVVLHTLAAFTGVKRLTRTLVVVAPGDVFFQREPAASFDVSDCGGPSRAASVLGGLRQLLSGGAQPGDWVLVHDAARCLITPEQINRLMDACAGDEVGGLLAHKLPDTLKSETAGRVRQTIDRSDKWLAQTPQMFRVGMLIHALEHGGVAVTDESSAMEALGLAPMLVPGNAQNFKLTYPEDFALAEAILLHRAYTGAVAAKKAS